MTKHEKILFARKATSLLRRAGFNSIGRKPTELDPKQAEFERQVVRTPMGGKPAQ